MLNDWFGLALQALIWIAMIGFAYFLFGQDPTPDDLDGDEQDR